MAGETLRTLLAVVALSLPLLAQTQTQTRPSFAGKWELVPENGTQPTTPPGFPPVPPLTISQDATTITVSKLVFRPPVNGQPSDQQAAYSLTFTFDGKEHPEPPPVPPLPEGLAASPGTDPKYVAEWTGDQLVITTRVTINMNAPTERVTKVTYSIDKKGFLVVETVRTAGTLAGPPPARSRYRKASAQSSSSIDKNVVTLRPSGAQFQIPEHMASGTQTRALTTYLTRAELDQVKAPLNDEWDRPFGAIVNAVLPFDRCAAHIGTEPFGPGRTFSDLQVRAYILDGAAKPVLEAIAGAGRKKAEEFYSPAVPTTSAVGAWTLGSLAYQVRHADYRANARVDFYLREFGQQTAVLVFMYSPGSRWSWDEDISAIVGSFKWPGGP